MARMLLTTRSAPAGRSTQRLRPPSGGRRTAPPTSAPARLDPACRAGGIAPWRCGEAAAHAAPAIGAAERRLEQAAERSAEHAMRLPAAAPGARARARDAASGATSVAQFALANPGPLVQRQATGGAPAAAPALASRINGHGAVGRPLAEPTRIDMEARFGADFGAVRIHTDGHAVQASRTLHAQAFTIGNDIFFERAKYQPGSAAGARLLAHELSHVVQQQSGDVAPHVIQRAHAEANRPPATEPPRPVDCAAEITSTRTCGYLIGEMIRLQFDIAELDRFIEIFNSQGNVDAAVAHTLRKAELQMQYNEKERIRAACCPDSEVPPIAPTAPFTPAAPPAAPSASPQPAPPAAPKP